MFHKYIVLYRMRILLIPKVVITHLDGQIVIRADSHCCTNVIKFRMHFGVDNLHKYFKFEAT